MINKNEKHQLTTIQNEIETTIRNIRKVRHNSNDDIFKETTVDITEYLIKADNVINAYKLRHMED